MDGQTNENVNGNRTTSESYVPSLPLSSHDTSSSPGSKHSRVTSTVAQSFAADLDSMFGLSMGGGSNNSNRSTAESGGVEVLSQTVEEKYEL